MALPRLGQRQWLAGMALACVAGVVAALVAQYGFDMRPCPWCILQRVIFIAIALVCALGALSPVRPVQVGAALLALPLTFAGMAAALWQHFVAAKSESCALTFADRIITALGLETSLPALFQITASCADAAVSVLGIPFDVWSLTLYVLLAAAALFSLRSPR